MIAHCISRSALGARGLLSSTFHSRSRSHKGAWAVAHGLALCLLLSCSDPLGEASPPVGAGEPRFPVLTASVTGFQHDIVTGRDHYELDVQAVDSLGGLAGGAPLSWTTLAPLDSVSAPDQFGRDGSAAVQWVTRDTLAALHLLRLRSGNGPILRITGQGQGLWSSNSIAFASDTVLGEVRGGIDVRLLALDRAQPVGGQVLVADVLSGGGRLGSIRLVTDSTGRARTHWWFGRRAGLQSVEVRTPYSAAYRLQDLNSGAVSADGTPLQVSAVALPGAPETLTLAHDTVSADAIGARIRLPTLAHDRYGNAIAQPPLRLATLDTTIAVAQGDGSLVTLAPGVARVSVTAGAATNSAVVVVAPATVNFAVRASVPKLTYLGARAVLTAYSIDRLGSARPIAAASYRLLTPSTASLAGLDTVVALQPGQVLIEAVIEDSVTDTLGLAVEQVPASVRPSRLADTTLLDRTARPLFTVVDSGGTPLITPGMTLESSDSSVVQPQGDSLLLARYPGEVTITGRSGTAVGAYRLAVEGVAYLADGVRSPGASAVNSAKTLELSNGRIRLRWGPGVGERGAFIVDTRIGGTWHPATVRGAGDWLYVTSTVVTEPTSVTVVEDSPQRIAIAMRFGDHRFDPVLGAFPDSFQNLPFPFTRTVWLSPGQYGYFTWTQLETTLPYPGYTELEVGFGGLFGPASIATGQVQFRTDTLTANNNFNLDAVPDAVRFELDGDPLERVLVPLPESPLISPFFPGRGYGSVYIHRLDYESYGAYLYAAPRGVPVDPHALCLEAWSAAPFPLRTLSASEVAQCGGS